MAELFLVAGCFLAVMGVVLWLGYRRYAAPDRIARQLGGPLGERPYSDGRQETGGSMARGLRAIGRKVPSSPQETASIRKDLVQAGFRAENAVALFYGVKIVSTVVLVMLALLFRESLTVNPVLRVVVVFFAGAMGFFGTGLALERMIMKRQKRLRLSLPDALDLMVVSVEAGLGLDQAIMNVSRELTLAHPAISEELSLVNLEMRAGKRRADALHNLAERTGEPELRKLVSILVQSDRFGTSIAEALRTHSDFMRVRRRQDAEERAGKVGVKLVFPIFFFILPSMMVVAAGPGLLQLFKNLFPLMKSFGG